jgi:hypothetical protein
VTDRFVRGTTGNNANSGADWNNAKQTVAGAIAIAGAGDTIYVDNGESFTATAAITWTPPAGALAIISCIRSSTTGVSWNAATGSGAGAAESVGAASNSFIISNAGGSAIYLFGMTLNAGTNNSALCSTTIFNSTNVQSTLEADFCTFDMKSVSTSASFNIGQSAASNRSHKATLRNCTFICSAARAGTFSLIGEAQVEIITPTFSMSGVTKPVILFACTGLGDTALLTIRDGDASGFSTTASAYFSVANFSSAQVLLKNLKLSATPTLTTGTWPGGTGAITLRNCDSADTIITFQYVNTYGTLTQSTSIYYTASPYQFNATGVSWQIVTSTLANESNPFITPPLRIWGTTTSAQTAEIEFVRDNATALTDRQIWSDLESAASASFPNYAYASNRNTAPFSSAGVDQPSSSVSWTGTGGFSNLNRQKLQITFTAAEVGLLQAQVFVGKASETLYLNSSITSVT